MKEQLISFETAKLAKEKGFNEGFSILCLKSDFGNNGYVTVDKIGKIPDKYYNSNLMICTQSLFQKWLREEHKLEILVYCNASSWMWEINKAYYPDSISGGTSLSYSDFDGPNLGGGWETYEEALEVGLITAIKSI